MERLLSILLAAALLAGGPSLSIALVLHPQGEPDPAAWTDRPDPNTVGRWSGNASCVAVSSNCIITTRHQGGGTGTSVYFGEKRYVVEETWNEPDADGAADLRVCRIASASGGPTHLDAVAALYTATSERNETVVIGGFGMGRGEILGSYGYEWDGGGNQTRRWGQNRIDLTASGRGETFSSDVIIADFDPYGSPGVFGARDYEAAIAAFDSGGGWYIEDGGQWKLAGLSHQVTGHESEVGETWYSPPDDIDAVRVSSYASWIESVIPQRIAGDLDYDDWVDYFDFALLAAWWQAAGCDESNGFCGGADFPPRDGVVGGLDLDRMAANWLSGY
jgi:hypothetical protein